MSRDIAIDLIDADANQPRRHFDAESLQELADSLAAEGQIVPITVRPVGERFVIVQGERRWRAAQLAGLSTLRAEVAEVDADAAYLLALIENVQRNDLKPLEEANAYERLLANGFNQTTLGKRIGKSQSYIAQKIRLLKLPADVQVALQEGALMEGHARQLLRLEDAETTTALCQRALAAHWTVDRLWHEVTFHLLVTKPSDHYKFKDLVDFMHKLESHKDLAKLVKMLDRFMESDKDLDEGWDKLLYKWAKQLEPSPDVGNYYLYWRWTCRTLGRILNFGERVWEKYGEPEFVVGLLENESLTEIHAWIEIDEDLQRIGFDLRNLSELARLPEAEFDDLAKRVVETVEHEPDDDYSDRLHRELFTQAHQLCHVTYLVRKQHDAPS